MSVMPEQNLFLALEGLEKAKVNLRSLAPYVEQFGSGNATYLARRALQDVDVVLARIENLRKLMGWEARSDG